MSNLQFEAQHIPSGLNQLEPIGPSKETNVFVANRAIASLEQFCSGPLIYQVTVPENRVWKPRQSYFRIRAKVAVVDGAQQVPQQGVYVSSVVNLDKFTSRKQFHVTVDDAKHSSLALAFNAPSVLMKDMSVTLKENKVSATDNVAQIDTLLKRMQPRELQKTLTPYLNSSFWSRHKAISEDVDYESAADDELKRELYTEQDSGIPSGSEVEMLWQPSFGVLGMETLPPGDWKININPERASTIKNSFVQSLHNAASQAGYSVDILDFRYFATFEEAGFQSLANKTFTLDRIEHIMQQKQLNNSGLSQQHWDVQRSLVGVALAFQAGKALSSFEPKYSKTLFTAPSDAVAMVEPGETQAQLTKLWLNVNNQIYPKDRYDLPDSADAHAVYNQLYVDNLINSGTVLVREPAEGFDAFYELGPYAYWQLKLSAQCPPQIQSNHAFQNVGDWADLQLQALMFAQYRTVSVIEYDGTGAVKRITQSDV